MKKFNLSIGIPAYNEQENISQLIKKIFMQQGDNFKIRELLVVSDGSYDQTTALVKSFQDRRIRLFEGKTRKGQNFRLNQIARVMDIQSDGLLIMEADILPVNKKFIYNLISKVPANRNFSYIASNSIMLPAKTNFGKIVFFGFQFKKKIFEKALSKPNLYLYATSRLISKEFIKTFRWSEEFHEDSYCYREAIKSKLPLYRSTKATYFIKGVESFKDYLLQSGKFQKAKDIETKDSNIYKVKINVLALLKILISTFFTNPLLLVSYFFIFCFSRIYSLTLPKYHVLWKTYVSSKKLNYN